MYYANVSFSQFIGAPTIGFSRNNLAPNLTNGLLPAFYLDDGFPQDVIRYPPFIDPTFANGGDILWVPEDGLTLPRFQNWSVTVKRQLTENMMLDLSYIGNRGSRLNHHWRAQRARLATERPRDPGARAPRVLNAPIELAGRGGPRDLPSLPGLHRERGPGAAEVSPVPEHRLREASPWAAASTTPSQVVLEQRVDARPPVPRRLHATPS